MKLKLFSLTMLLAISAFAAPAKPLISKSSGGGFMMPEYAGGERCDLYSDRVVISNTFGMQGPTAVAIAETRAISLKGNLQAIINQAKTEQVTTKPNNLCDGPATSIVANDGSANGVLLFSTGGCGSAERTRNGIASDKLRNLVNLFCPKTYSFAQEENQ